MKMNVSFFGILAAFATLTLVSASPTPIDKLLERSETWPPCTNTGPGVCNLYISTPKQLGAPGSNPFRTRTFRLYNNECVIMQTVDIKYPSDGNAMTTLRGNLSGPVHVVADDQLFPAGHIEYRGEVTSWENAACEPYSATMPVQNCRKAFNCPL